MTQHAHNRGWPIQWDGKQWINSETRKPFDNKRACRRCGRKPTPEGYDACLGHIDGVTSACCGHGVENQYHVDDKRKWWFEHMLLKA